MKTKHLVLSLLALILGFVLTGCAGMTTSSIPELSCTKTDINAMLASGDYQKKADNFLIIQDATSSMSNKPGKSSGSTLSKLALSKGLIMCFNNALPEDINVNGGMRVVGPLSSEKGLVYGMTKFTNAGLEDGIHAIGGTGSRTDVGTGLTDGSNDLKTVSGRNAVIILSDGITAKSDNPQSAAAAMKEMFGNEVCIYTILLGNDPNGRTTMEQIAAEGRCGFATDATNLYMRPLTECDTVNVGKGMGDFVASVFLEKYVPPPPEPPKCILDSDGDGVVDCYDKCPDTPKGIEVDKDGCPIPLKEKVSITLLVEFDFDKDEVKFPFHDDIEKVANLLKAYPKTDAELEGHTDSIGTEEYNMGLSRRRAESVKKYLIETFGIEESRISTIGYGESMPVDTNDTEEGRQNNRRVVANIEAVIK